MRVCIMAKNQRFTYNPLHSIIFFIFMVPPDKTAESKMPDDDQLKNEIDAISKRIDRILETIGSCFTLNQDKQDEIDTDKNAGCSEQQIISQTRIKKII